MAACGTLRGCAYLMSYFRVSRDLKRHAILYFLTYEYSWGQLMGYGFFFCSLPEASSLLQLGPVQKLGWGRCHDPFCQKHMPRVERDTVLRLGFVLYTLVRVYNS